MTTFIDQKKIRNLICVGVHMCVHIYLPRNLKPGIDELFSRHVMIRRWSEIDQLVFAKYFSFKVLIFSLRFSLFSHLFVHPSIPSLHSFTEHFCFQIICIMLMILNWAFALNVVSSAPIWMTKAHLKFK